MSYHYSSWWWVSLWLPCSPLQILKGCYKVSTKPLLQAEQSTFSAWPLSAMLQSFCWTCSNNSILSFLCCVTTTLCRLKVVSQQSRVEGQNVFPHPAGHVAFDAAQDMTGFQSCEYTLVAQVEFSAKHHPQILLLDKWSPEFCLNLNHTTVLWSSGAEV